MGLSLASIASFGAPATSAAAPTGTPDFSLVQRDCPELDERALRELVDLELRTLSASNSAVRVEIACSDRTAAVSVTDALGRAYPISSRVDFSDAGPGARERLVALAATELVAQTQTAARSRERAQTTSNPPPPNSDTGPRSADGAPSTAPTGPRAELALLGEGTLLGSPTTLLVGGALGARVGLGGPWAAVVDFRMDKGKTETGLADAAWTMLGGSAALVLEHRLGIARLGFGVGARAGRLTLDGSAPAPDSGRTVSGALLGPIVPVRLSLDIATHAAFVAALEVGYVTLPVRGTVAGGPPIVEAKGPWASLGIGVAATF